MGHGTHVPIEISIDRGGTFTDCVRWGPEGAVRAVKVLSDDDAPVRGIRALLDLGDDDPLPAVAVRLGTTVATNALLERRTARVALVVTEGFEDVLEIGTQARPALFAVDIKAPRPLTSVVVPTAARATPWGEIERPVDDAALAPRLAAARAAGADALAVAVLFGARAPDLERDIGALARAAGFPEVVLSHVASATTGLLARAETAVVDAALTPLALRALGALRRALRGGALLVMQSSGDLASAAVARGKDLVLSGPAGGVVATAALARAHGALPCIGFDMGGTSTDVCRVDERGVGRAHETEIGGVRLRTPHVAIDTVAAGGGSICHFDGAALVVGPESAGARPGPLVYGHPDAREPCVTDMAVATGRLVGDRFPFPLDEARVRGPLAALAARVDATRAPEAVAEAFLEVAAATMAGAVQRVTTARGHDVRAHTLVVYGGAGGLAMCALMRRLGITRALVPVDAGVFSARGIGEAALGQTRVDDIGPFALDDEGVAAARAAAEEIARALTEELSRPGAPSVDVEVFVRDRGTEDAFALPLLPVDDARALAARYEAAFRARYRFFRDDEPRELVRVAVRVSAPPPTRGAARRWSRAPGPRRTARVFVDGAWRDAPVFDREALPREAVAGPALVLDAGASCFIEPGFQVAPRDDGTLVVEGGAAARAAHPEIAAAALALFAGAFKAIAEEMGEIVRRTALSVNMRERLDFSCAVFDADGELVVNAPHIPVHLGAMQESVMAVVRAHPDMRPGDAYATNDPAAGGSHLPDITVVTPVFVDDAPPFFVASRGHHADVGGVSPGSMPPFSQRLDEEGVVFAAVRVARDGALDEAVVRAVLGAGPHPARDPATNVADLRAQLAANARGATLLAALVDEHGAGRVREAMREIQSWAAARMEAAIARLGPETRRFADALDDGTPVVVTLRVPRPGRLVVDFAGTGPASPTNLNAPRAVVRAAVLYALRVLVDEEIPLSAGALRPVELVIPEGSILDPPPGAAVCGGNVETSQRVVDVLLGALGIAAASQGTMNNLTFGDARGAYYETIGGGAGAGPSFTGASAVHSHMTNTRITDAEVLEDRFPVSVRRFAIRRGSGGAGHTRGGDGIVRTLVARAPLDAAILSERRERAPFGLAGGEPGAKGANRLDDVELGGKARFAWPKGATLTIETPGGGGYGAPAGPASRLLKNARALFQHPASCSLGGFGNPPSSTTKSPTSLPQDPAWRAQGASKRSFQHPAKPSRR